MPQIHKLSTSFIFIAFRCFTQGEQYVAEQYDTMGFTHLEDISDLSH